jgi:uncharacterized protein (TIGR00299 family) protein
MDNLTKILYIDPIAGISGDMFLAACVDLGVNEKQLISKLLSLNFASFDIKFNIVTKKGIRALETNISLHDNQHEHNDLHTQHSQHQFHSQSSPHSHRHLHQVLDIIEASSLPINVKSIAATIFTAIAQAEAHIHSTTLEQVHFHEVGAIDSILDIVGAAICIDELQVDKIVCGKIPTGYGVVNCEHGQFPVPAPATLELLKGVPIRNLAIDSELTTPTGAAIVKCVVSEFSSAVPDMTILAIGYGAGKRNLEQPNVLRLILGEQKSHDNIDYSMSIEINQMYINEAINNDQYSNKSPYVKPYITKSMWMLEATIDDMQPELYQYIITQLIESGANDVMIIPAILKKGRAGSLLHILCEANDLSRIKETIFRETSTLGVRQWPIERHSLERDFRKVIVRGHEITIKIGLLDNLPINLAPEYEDCKRVAIATDTPLKTIFQEAIAQGILANVTPSIQ